MISQEKQKTIRQKVLIFIVLFVSVIIGFFISMTNGSVNISVSQIINAIFTNTQNVHRQVILNIRLPRTVLSILVGINLALSGGIMQAVMHNPLADPGIIGVSAGAGFFGIFILLIFPEMTAMMPPITFIGAMIAVGMVYMLSWKRGLRPIRIILAGVAVNAFFGAGISALMIFYSDRVQGALLFMSGTLSATTWNHVITILPYTIIGILLTLTQTEKLNLLLLGDETATGLGLNVNSSRLVLTAISAVLAASAVSVVGLLGFVGLVVPHISRMIIGSNYKTLIPSAALLGAFVLLCSDTFARNIFSPVEIPVGIVMAVLGTPFFLFLLRRSV